MKFKAPEHPMGFGWTTSNIPNLNINYHDALDYFPSSTKAETMAILTALLLIPYGGIITIVTDSQSAINTVYNTIKLSVLSKRRLQKINNVILWKAIHYIIDKLSLTLFFQKVKAHSSDLFNDIADAEAKSGCFVPIPLTILHKHLPSHTLSIIWNSSLPIDCNVRRRSAKLLIRKSSFAQELTRYQICYCGRYYSLAWYVHVAKLQWTHGRYVLSHTKDLSWKIKTSTKTLPMLDILNRNYPKIIKDCTTCLLCKECTESNDHRNCTFLYQHVKLCFKELANNLEILLVTKGDNLTGAVINTINSSSTFHWALLLLDTSMSLLQHALF